MSFANVRYLRLKTPEYLMTNQRRSDSRCDKREKERERVDLKSIKKFNPISD